MNMTATLWLLLSICCTLSVLWLVVAICRAADKVEEDLCRTADWWLIDSDTRKLRAQVPDYCSSVPTRLRAEPTTPPGSSRAVAVALQTKRGQRAINAGITAAVKDAQAHARTMPCPYPVGALERNFWLQGYYVQRTRQMADRATAKQSA